MAIKEIKTFNAPPLTETEVKLVIACLDVATEMAFKFDDKVLQEQITNISWKFKGLLL